MNDRDEARRRHFADPAVQDAVASPEPEAPKKKASKKRAKKKATKS